MPTEQRSRLQLRQSVGHEIGAMQLTSATTGGGTTAMFIQDLFVGGNANAYDGWHMLPTSAGSVATGPAGEIKRIVSGTSAGLMAISSANPYSVAGVNGTQVELWEPDIPPGRIHDFINRALADVTRKGAPPGTSFALHVGRRVYRYDIPSTITGIQRLSYRRDVRSVSLHTCDAVWNEAVDADVTAAVDTEDYRQGSGSLRLTVAAGASALDVLATDNITSTDLNRYTHLEFWIKSTVATAAGDLHFLLDNTAACLSPLETLSIPALTANTWTYVRLALANPQTDIDIISVGLRYTIDIGAAVIWLDGIQAVEAESEVWEAINPSFWYIEQDNRRIVFSEEAYSTAGYSLLMIEGVKKPTLLTAETSLCEVDAEFVINKAIALAYRSRANRRSDNYEAAMRLADMYDQKAEQRRARLQMPMGVRWVADA